MSNLEPIGLRLPEVRGSDPDDPEDEGLLPEVLVFDWWAWYGEPAPGRGARSSREDPEPPGPTPEPPIVEEDPYEGTTTMTWLGPYGEFDPTGIDECQLLIVAGGGGGAPSYAVGEPGGGGGGGGVIYDDHFDLTGFPAHVMIPIHVADTPQSYNGQDSSFGGLVAKGGGAGTNHHPDGSQNGGSGGGAYSSSVSSPGTGIPGQGNPGGNKGGRTPPAAGGGGGALQDTDGIGGNGYSPPDGSYYVAGKGGKGFTTDISGSNLEYGSGGSAAYHPYVSSSGGATTGGGGIGARLSQAGPPLTGPVTGSEATDGDPTSGGGGGGGCRLWDLDTNTMYGNPGKGGTGVVIVKFDTPPYTGIETRVGDYVYTTFEESGVWMNPSGATIADILIVAGGGAGGSPTSGVIAGGGGGGGLLWADDHDISTFGPTVTVTVGAGGLPVSNNHGGSGGSSAFGPLSIPGGGGGGGGASLPNGQNGGSGGGGGALSGFGRPGGSSTVVFDLAYDVRGRTGGNGNYDSGSSLWCGGGGGGANGGPSLPITGNGAAGNAFGLQAGHGGRAFANTATSTASGGAFDLSVPRVESGYAAGGGGAGDAANSILPGLGGYGSSGTGTGGGGDGGDGSTAATSGLANTGGGGGGAYDGYLGGAGGSGVVIVRVYDPI